MPTQTEILEALDRVVKVWLYTYTDQKQAANDAATLTALREQIAMGPVVYFNRHNGVYSSKHFDFFDAEYQALYAITGEPE